MANDGQYQSAVVERHVIEPAQSFVGEKGSGPGVTASEHTAGMMSTWTRETSLKWMLRYAGEEIARLTGDENAQAIMIDGRAATKFQVVARTAVNALLTGQLQFIDGTTSKLTTSDWIKLFTDVLKQFSESKTKERQPQTVIDVNVTADAILAMLDRAAERKRAVDEGQVIDVTPR